MEDFKNNLLTKDVKKVYRRYLLGHDIWLFREHIAPTDFAQRYDDFKIYISEKLNLHVNNIAIVGSAKLGFSLAPDNNFRKFNEDSDIDIVIVSQSLFKQSWDAYFDLKQKGYLPTYAPVAKDIFRRFVNLKNPDIRSTFFDEWTRIVEPCKKDLQVLFSIPHDINYRIYDSWESVEQYHCSGLEALKNKLEAENG